MTRVCPAAQAKMVAIVRWPRGGSDRGRSPCLVLLAVVEVGALIAPVSGAEPGSAPLTGSAKIHAIAMRFDALTRPRHKPRHDLRYTSVHFSRPYPVRSNSNSTNCCAEKDLRACRRRV